MTKQGADDKFGPAVIAGSGTFELDYRVGRQKWRTPKFLMSLIGYFCHKDYFP
jgi:hypothetical protein